MLKAVPPTSTAGTFPLGDDLRPLIGPIQQQLQALDAQAQQLVAAYLIGKGLTGRVSFNMQDWTYTVEDAP